MDRWTSDWREREGGGEREGETERERERQREREHAAANCGEAVKFPPRRRPPPPVLTDYPTDGLLTGRAGERARSE